MSSPGLRTLLLDVVGILDRDLRAVRREIEAYPDEADLWRLPDGIENSAGTLALHLAGNVRHYFGARLAATGYVRDRDGEFARRGVPRAEIAREIEAAREALRQLVDGSRELPSEFPEIVGGVRVATAEYLVHLVAHFAYHLGQLDYHRRVVTGQTAGVGAVRAAELRSARQPEGE